MLFDVVAIFLAIALAVSLRQILNLFFDLPVIGYSYLSFGSVYITQVFLTIGGVTKFIPSTGVTLPLVSYGGSSIVSTFIIFQVIQGLYVLKRGEEEEEENSSEEE